MPYHLRLLVNRRLAFSTDVEGSLEIGRQRAGESDELKLQPIEGGHRLVIAPLAENSVGRKQVVLRQLSDAEMEIENASETLQLRVFPKEKDDGTSEKLRVMKIREVCRFSLPLGIEFNGERTIELDLIDNQRPLEGLTEVTNAPRATMQSGELSFAIQKAATVRLGPDVQASAPILSQLGDKVGLRDNQQSEFLVVALQKVMDVFQTASTADQLFKTAVEGAYSLLDLDTARVLSCCDGKWSEEITFPEQKHRSISSASNNVLRRVLQEHRTFWDVDRSRMRKMASLQNVEAVVAAPILSTDGTVIGALYGDRRDSRSITDFRSSLTSLEARLLELLACGISSGLARQHQEAEARKMRLQFEQFFSPKLAVELEKNPNLLTGRDAEVSILFCDIRGFSRITERIGTSKTFDWIGDVMGDLSDCVLKNNGVLVDYIGDELMAMWGAPQPQENHRELACRAAQEMLSRLPIINERWYSQLGEAMDLGIGINSGTVKVGNSGSQHKFKYSPLGNAVNLASRVQGATKHLGVRLLVTGETAETLPEEFVTRALCDVQVVNMDTPVRLIEVLPSTTPETLIEGYARALRAFEAKEFRSAANHTGKLIEEFPEDVPSLVLLSRIVDALMNGPPSGHPVWKLPGK